MCSELSVTGLTSNPTIFEQAIKNSSAYDAAIRQKLGQGRSSEELFFELALDDLTRAADVFRPIYDRTDGVDGWVSLEVSPLLAYDTAGTIAAAKDLFARANRPNLMIKIPGTREGLPAIEEAIFAGIPINVTLLFSREHYFAAAEAFMRGIERRLDAGLKPDVGSVASVFVSRWDVAVKDKVPEALRNQLGLAARQAHLQGVSVAAQLTALAAHLQRRRPAAAPAVGEHRQPRIRWPPTFCTSRALAAPFTVNTMPEGTLKALADHGDIPSLMRADGGNCEEILTQFAAAGIDIHALAGKLQTDAAASFVKSWNELMAVIDSKGAALKRDIMTKAKKVLAIDIGGTGVKILATGQTERRRFPSGRQLTPELMVSEVKKLCGGLEV